VLEAILDNQGQQYPTNKDRQKLTLPVTEFLSQCSHVVTQPYTIVLYSKVKVTKLYDTKVIQYKVFNAKLTQ